MTRFITLAGRKQTGKDTSAGIIYSIIEPTIKRTEQVVDGFRLHPSQEYEIHIVHFADALKEACALIFGIDRRDMETEEGKKKLTDVRWPIKTMVEMPGDEIRDVWYPEPDDDDGQFMTVREILQFVGTDLFRTQMDPDIWVKSVFRRKYGENDIVIIADARFPNEAAFAKKHGLLVKIERNQGKGSEDLHISERALDNYTDYDAIIDNNTDLVVLKEKWVEILRGQKFIA
jgi:deoxynucleotide monophosphate kinase-like protein